MAANVERICSEIEVPVVDQAGVEINMAAGYADLSPQVIRNTPLGELFPGELVVVIDWLAMDGKKPSVEELQVPVVFDGKKYHGAYGWGSMVKMGKTIGLTKDIGQDAGMFKFVEDGVRLKRWLLAEGVWGGFRADDLRVLVVEPGEIIDGLPVEDGFGYIADDLAVAGHNGHGSIHLGGSRDSSQFWQFVPWMKPVRELCEPILFERMVALSDPMTRALTGSEFQEGKKRWLDLDEQMVYHPYVANALARQGQDLFYRSATTVPTGAQVRVAVPAMPGVETVATTEDIIAWRYPIDQNGTVRPIEGIDTPEMQAEIERVEALETIQFSMSSRTFFASGVFGVVPRSQLSGADIIICSENIKLAVEGVKNARKRLGVRVEDGIVVTFCQWWSAGSAISINAEWYKRVQGGDYDGDLETIIQIHQEDVDWAPVAEELAAVPVGTTPKLRKSKQVLAKEDNRAKMVVNCMENLVGFACNLRDTTFMTDDREAVARRLGWSSEGAMDAALNFYIKCGTDGHKSGVLYRRRRVQGRWKDFPVTLTELMQELGRLQSTMLRVFGVVCPWARWKGDDYMFRHQIPKVVTCQAELEEMRPDDAKMAVRWWMNGTVAEVARITLPSIEASIEHQISARPLTHYLEWAPKVSEDTFEVAKSLQIAYNIRVKRVNFTDADGVRSFKAGCVERFKAAAETLDVSEAELGYALWRAAHGARSKTAGAGSVFLSCPDVAEHIIADRPGKNDRAKSEETVVLGLGFNLLSPPPSWAGEVEIREVWQSRGGKRVARKALIPIDTQEFAFRPKGVGSPWPLDMIGVVAADQIQPEEGCYLLDLRQLGPKSWAGVFSPLG